MGAFAHSGRTDSSGGHKDNRNASGLGSYHYHHGYGPHLHPSEYCPYQDVFPTKVSLTSEKTTFGIREKGTISASVSPSNACSTTVTWTSSDSTVVRVSGETIEAVGYGTATISASTFNDKTGTIKITVKEIVADKVSIIGFDEVEKRVMHIGNSYNIKAEIMPSNVDDTTLTWTTSNADIATVENGIVTAQQVGIFTLTVSTANGKTDSVDISAEEVVAEKIDISAQESIMFGEETQLNAVVYPENTTYKDIVWQSSDENIVTIDEEGNLRTVGIGDVTITVLQKDVQATVLVKVLPIVVESIEIMAEPNINEELNIGESAQLFATVSPDNATYKNISWYSSDSEIATVDENGLVNAIARGEVIVYAQSADGIEEAIQLKIGSKSSPVAAGAVVLIVIGGALAVFHRRKRANS